MKILAIDLGKSKSVACVYEAETAAHRFVTLQSTPSVLHDLIAAEAPARVVIEVGSTAGWVCDLCRAMGVEVQVANPNGEAWHWKNVKRKTDRDDALKLARLSAMHQLGLLVHMPTPEVRAWRETIEHRHTLVCRRTAIKNSIRALLTRRAMAWPAGQAGWSLAKKRELGALAAGEDGAPWRRMLGLELEQLKTVDVCIRRAEKELDTMAAQDQRVELLRTIPGVGPRLAETVVAVIDNPHRFESGRKVGSYAGLTPRQHQSGEQDRRGRISRRGHRLLRSLLVEAAWMGLMRSPWMRRVYQRALGGKASRKRIAIVALARRLLIVCWAMLRDQAPWRGDQEVKLRLAA
jgi:transposase